MSQRQRGRNALSRQICHNSTNGIVDGGLINSTDGRHWPLSSAAVACRNGQGLVQWHPEWFCGVALYARMFGDLPKVWFSVALCRSSACLFVWVLFAAMFCFFLGSFMLFRSKPTATEVNETECATQKAPWKPCGFRNWCFYSIWFSHVFPRQRIAWRNVAITTPASVAGGSLINLPWHFAIDSMKCIWLLESIHSQ